MNEILKQARRYWIAAGCTGIAHYRAGEAAARWHKIIGIPNVILASVVATSVFATLQEDTTNHAFAIVTGIIAVAAAILAALLAFLNLADKAEKHKSAGVRYATLRHRIEIFRLEFEKAADAKKEEALKVLKELAADLGTLDAESPSLSEAMFKKGVRDFNAKPWPEN